MTMKRRGQRLERLAELGSGIIRSCDEQRAHVRMMRATRRGIEARLAHVSRNVGLGEHYRQETTALRAELRAMYAPVWRVAVACGDITARYYVSADVLTDWRREYKGAMTIEREPARRRIGSRGIRLTDAQNTMIETAREWRANQRGLGMAQNAFRAAKVEGDADGMRFAYSWLWHGDLSPCRDDDCEQCQRDNRTASIYRASGARAIGRAMERQHDALLTLAQYYIDAADTFGRAPKAPTYARHRMPSATAEQLHRSFCRDTFDLLTAAPAAGSTNATVRPDAKAERERAAIERLRAAIVAGDRRQ